MVTTNDQTTLRASMRHWRQVLDQRFVRAAGLAIGQKLNSLSDLQQSGLMAFIPFDNEPDITDFLETYLETNHQLILPKIQNQQIAPYMLRKTGLGTQLCRHRWGMLEPHPDHTTLARQDQIAVVLVPGCVFDVFGCRIGMGGGFYDRWLSVLPSQPQKIGIAYEHQVLEQIPQQPSDVAVHRIVTEHNTYEPRQTEVYCPDETATQKVAEALARIVTPPFYCALQGPVGVGKTTFARYFMQQLGAQEALTSQSYLLAAMTNTPHGVIAHLDGYRLVGDYTQSADTDLLVEYLELADYLFIEWAEHQPRLLPKDAVRITSAYCDAPGRQLVLSTVLPQQSPWHDQLSQQLGGLF